MSRNGIIMRKIVTISLLLLFSSTFALPLFSSVDDCDMSCCQMVIPCCELAYTEEECPGMAKGQDTRPILLPMVPQSPTTKTDYFPVLHEIQINDPNFHSYSSSFPKNDDYLFGSHIKIPFYFLTHSLLI